MATYTREELTELIGKTELKLEEFVAAFPNARPVPPLSTGECLEYIFALLERASERPLTRDECFLHGQLLSQFRQIAVQTIGDG